MAGISFHFHGKGDAFDDGTKLKILYDVDSQMIMESCPFFAFFASGSLLSVKIAATKAEKCQIIQQYR